MPSPPKVSLSPRKQARQERATATVEAIVEAAARILRTDGHAALTTNRIADVAGVSVGSLYQYFPNKEAILVALIEAQLGRDEQMAQAVTQCSPQVAEPQPPDADLATALSVMLQQICEHQYQLAPLLRQLLPLLSPLRQEELVRQRLREMCAHFERFLDRYVDELRAELQEDRERRRAAIAVMTDAVRGALNAATTSDPELLLTEPFQSDVRGLALGLLRR